MATTFQKGPSSNCILANKPKEMPWGTETMEWGGGAQEANLEYNYVDLIKINANDCQDQHIVGSVESALWHSLAATYLGAPSVVYISCIYICIKFLSVRSGQSAQCA